MDSNSLAKELVQWKRIKTDIHALRMALMRYYKQGLLKRERSEGVFLYSLSQRGVQRMHWLESR